MYWAIMVFIFGGTIGSVFYASYYRSKLSSADANVIAHAMGKGFGHCFWLCSWLFVCFLLVATVFYRYRRPIFGRKDIKYGPPAYPRVYPLLMKNKPKFWVSPKEAARKKRRIVVLLCVLLITFLFSVAMYPRSLYGRYELLRDGTVREYDPHNQQSTCYAIADIKSVCLDTNRSSGGKYSSGDCYARMTICFSDGEKCRFSIRSFGADWKTAIQMAQSLKASYGALVYIEDAENLWKVVRDTDISSEEESMLYQLFEVE